MSILFKIAVVPMVFFNLFCNCKDWPEKYRLHCLNRNYDYTNLFPNDAELMWNLRKIKFKPRSFLNCNRLSSNFHSTTKKHKMGICKMIKIILIRFELDLCVKDVNEVLRDIFLRFQCFNLCFMQTPIVRF